MSLGAHWKLYVLNRTGEAINASNITARVRQYKFTDGALVLASETTYTGDNTTLADGSYDDLGSAVDNTTNLYLGIVGTLECDLSGETAPSGTVDLFLKKSSDGTNWVDDAQKSRIFLCSAYWSGSAADAHAQIDY